MTTEARLSINGTPATAALLHVPPRGPWVCDLDLAEDITFSGRVTLRVGDLELVGTVVPEATGAYRRGGQVRVVAGAGGWEQPAPRRLFHADQGVKRGAVLQDTARAQGETLVIESGVDAVIGVDFLRQGYDPKKADRDGYPAASTVFARAGAPIWWVDYAGVTHVATERPAAETGAVQILDFDVRLGVAELADVAQVGIGSTLLIDDVAHTVRELRVHVTPQRARTRAVVVPVAMNRLYDALAAVVRQVTAEELVGLFRYRVFRMSVNRVELQVVDKRLGLPDAIPVSMWPGMAGLWAKLQPGSVVIVQFIEGSAARPIVTHYKPRDGAGFLPVELLLDATDVVHVGPSADEIRLGGDGGKAVHRVGDRGTAGTITAPTGTGTIVWELPDGSVQTIAFVSAAPGAPVAITIVPGAAGFEVITEAGQGSEKVTSQ